MIRVRLPHQSIALIIDCSVTIRTKFRTNSFTGTHWITVAGGTIKDGTVKVEDPGTTMAGWQRWPIQLLRAASDFGGNHWFISSPSTEDVDKTAVMRVAVLAEPRKGSKRLGMLAEGDTRHVVKTVKGGPWLRADGTPGHGWHKLGNGGFKGGKAS